jgi:hypothetical protein
MRLYSDCSLLSPVRPCRLALSWAWAICQPAKLLLPT